MVCAIDLLNQAMRVAEVISPHLSVEKIEDGWIFTAELREPGRAARKFEFCIECVDPSDDQMGEAILEGAQNFRVKLQ